MQRALFSNEAGQGSAPIAHSAARTDEPVREGVIVRLEPFVDTICVCTVTALVILLSGAWNRPAETVWGPGGEPRIVAGAPGSWTVERTPLAAGEAAEWRPGDTLYLIVEGDVDPRRGTGRRRLGGEVVSEDGRLWIRWSDLVSEVEPRLAGEGIFADYKGATLTARAFDRVVPGLGFWLVPAVAWLFAISTMISWSYYGEQGTIYLFGRRAVLPYRVAYCLLILAASSPLIRTESELDLISTLGTGLMLWANIPIMLLFGPQAMRAYHAYLRRLKAGEFERPIE